MIGISKAVSFVVCSISNWLALSAEDAGVSAKLDIAARSAEIWTIVGQALSFLTGFTLTALLLTAYLIKRVGFGIWRAAKRSV